MSQEMATLQKEAESFTVRLEALTITDATSYAKAGEWVKVAAAFITRVEEFCAPVIDAAHKAHKVAISQRDSLVGPVKGFKRAMGARMAEWDQQQEDIRRQAEETARRERERHEHEARQAAIAEERRLRADAEIKRLEEAAALEARGDTAAAERLLDAPLPVPIVMPAPVFVPMPPPVEVTPKVEGISYREEWDFEILDARLVPDEYKVIDEVRLRKVVRALRASTNIPGVRALSRKIQSVRA